MKGPKSFRPQERQAQPAGVQREAPTAPVEKEAARDHAPVEQKVVEPNVEPGISGPTLRGFVDGVTQGTIWGWVQNVDDPDDRVTVILFDGDAEIGRMVASQFRVDLLNAGIGDGKFGYEFHTPREDFDARNLRLMAGDQPTPDPQLRLKAPD